jgi:GNAT superfamily N-acetyltransferase
MLGRMGAVTFQREPIASLWPELLPLARDHWREVRWDDKTEADLDTARYEAAEAAGTYVIFTLRSTADGKPLIGYAAYWLTTSTQRRESLEAAQDGVYLRPDCRNGWLGYELMSEADKALRDAGIQIVYQHVRTNARDFGPVLRRLGYEPIETVYARRLNP